MTIQKIAEAKLPTHWGEFNVIAFEDKKLNEEQFQFIDSYSLLLFSSA